MFYIYIYIYIYARLSLKQLKEFDTLHDFGNTASNRNAQIGLKYLGITMPQIALPSPQRPE